MNRMLSVFTALAVLSAGLCAQVGNPNPNPLGPQSGTWTQVGPWVLPTGHTTEVFDSKMWVIGGDDGTGMRKFNQVLSSTDGVSWTRQAADAGWSARDNHASAVFNNELWVLGGDDGLRHNDIWSSPDGVNWSEHFPTSGSPMWSSRAGHTAVAFNNKLWVIGGYVGSAGPYLSDVWSTDNGVHWTPEATGAFPGRGNHTCIVHSGEMWVIGGVDGSGGLDDVWSSPDGVTWTEQTAAATGPRFSGRGGHASVAYNGLLWVFGGDDGAMTQDVWSSPDGQAWTEATAAANWDPRARHTAAVFNGALWVVGGDDGTPNVDAGRHDTWSSTDGVAWTLGGVVGVWSRRVYPATAVFDSRLWVLGGQENNGGSPGSLMNDVWSSPDGLTWTHHSLATGSPIWSARIGHAAVAFDNKLWVIGGGWKGSSTPQSDVWYTTDGSSWTLATQTPGWDPRYAHTVEVFNNRMWVIGGSDLSGTFDDVWSSDDGVQWTQHVPSSGSAIWPSRYVHTSAVFNNRLWVMGGRGSAGASLSDVWSSSDGADWTPETAAPGWDARFGHAAAVLDNRLWVMAGHPDEMSVRNDVWSSADGVSWDLETQPPWGPRSAALAQVAANRLWLIGGYDASSVFSEVWAYDPDAPPQITSTAPATAVVGQPYSYSVTTTGSPAPAITATGLPAWLSLTGSTLSGTPGAADIGLTGNITVTATNGLGSDDQVFQIDVQDAPPQITSTPVTTATVGTPYSYVVTATGSPTLSATGLPAWLSLSGDTLTGTPGAGDVGVTGTITITATNAAGTDVQTFQIDIEPTTGGPSTGGPSTSGSGGCAAGSNMGSSLVGLLLLLAAVVVWRRSRASRCRRVP